MGIAVTDVYARIVAGGTSTGWQGESKRLTQPSFSPWPPLLGGIRKLGDTPKPSAKG